MKPFLFMVMMIPVIWIPTPGRVVIVPPPQPGEIHIAPPPQLGQVEILLLRETQRTVQTSLSGPALLERIKSAANLLGVRIIMLKSIPQEESPEYIRHPLLVEAKSEYAETVKFIHSLEAFGLSVDDLHIQNDSKDPLRHRLKCTVSTFQFCDRI